MWYIFNISIGSSFQFSNYLKVTYAPYLSSLLMAVDKARYPNPFIKRLLQREGICLHLDISYAYLVQSTFFGVVKNSNRSAHCTETCLVEKDMGPSTGMEKRKLVCTRSATTSWWSLWTCTINII